MLSVWRQYPNFERMVFFMNLEQMEKLCEELGIFASAADFSFLREGFRDRDGCAIQKQGEKSVLYSDTLEGMYGVFVVAHEIGHHVLKHLTGERDISIREREIESNVFAGIFTALHLCKMAAAL
jgi:hypothetical protein